MSPLGGVGGGTNPAGEEDLNAWRCDDLTRSPRGYLRCMLALGHDQMHQVHPEGQRFELIPAAVVEGLRTQLAERDERIERLVRISNVNGDWNIKYSNLADERDRLAGQVAAIRALCDEHDRRSFNDLQRSRTADIRAITDLKAALDTKGLG